jgi:hypothetical protein
MEKVIQKPQVEPQIAPEIKKPLLRSFAPPKIASKKKFLIPAIAGVLIIVGGIGAGWFLSNRTSDKSKGPTPIVNDKEAKGSSDMVADESVFKDTAEGTLVEGGIEGEGTHHLDRGTGPQKYVYLTSSVIDLQSFVGKKVEVWGETLAGKEAGWLMDVGKVKVIE